jgi:hypothetical protein
MSSLKAGWKKSPNNHPAIAIVEIVSIFDNLEDVMKTLTALSLIATSAIATLPLTQQPARASWGDFFLGVGAGVGTSAIINNNRRAREERYRPVSPQQEYTRGLQDGINRARYDNPRNSPDYTRGFEEGLRRSSR